MKEVDLQIDAGRLLFGLSRIGYTTSSAICDIIDNSIRAKATKIDVLITKEREDLSDAKKNNVKQYIIIDNGCGMNHDELLNALKLGSSNEKYEQFSLSKFGLGLKSAAFSQCDTLKIISSNGTEDFVKYEVSLPQIIIRSEYFAVKAKLEEYELELIHKNLPEKRGTIVILDDVRKVNHPSLKKTLAELKQKVGVIYFYFLSDGVSIALAGDYVNAIDPLFVDEANLNGNLNEHVWDGQKVQWIERKKELILDAETNTNCEIEITQLPYPPVYKVLFPNQSKDVEIRSRYMIGAGNYGFYVYRNRRLIAWASSLDGILPQDQDYYAFRGRIFIDDTADDYFNIDVKKSTLTLSEEAYRTISDFSQEAKIKSRNAWKRANVYLKALTNKEPNEISNKIIEDFEQLELLPGDTEPREDVLKERTFSLEKEMKEKAQKMAIQSKQDQGEDIKDPNELTHEEITNAIKGVDFESPSITKIFRVTSVLDNLLWEPYHDAELGDCVRINKYHRFGRYIFEENSDNKDLQIIFDLILLQMAEAEIYTRRNAHPKYKYDDIVVLISEYRRVVSEFLANMCRRLDGQLPPFKDKENI